MHTSRLNRWITQVTQSTVLPSLIVKSGVHRLADALLPVGEISVGADEANTLIVSDVSVPTAFRLRWDGHSVTFTAVGSDVSVNGRSLRRGGRCRFNRSSSFTSGGIAFLVEWPVAPSMAAPARSRAQRGFAAAIACTVVLVAAAMLLPARSSPLPTRFVDLSRDGTGSISAGAGPNTVKNVVLPLARPAFDGRSLLGALRQQLASAELDGISVDLQPDGGVAASGRILPARREAWRSAARWFDTVAKGQAVLIDRVEVSAAAASLQIQAVYTGQVPYVIGGDGQKFFVGTSLPDGAVIQKIESQRVLVKRGGQIVAVRF